MIELRTAIPGPVARAAIERDNRVVSQSYTRDDDAPVVADHAQGVWVWDVDGNKLLDFAAGIAVCSTGHCHPEIVRVISEQAGKLIHLSGTDFYYMPQIDLAERIAAMLPGSFARRVFFANSGSETIEAALKLARYKTGRHYVLAFHGAFHGRTMGALSLSASKAVHHKGFGALVPGVIHVSYPYCYRCPANAEPGSCSIECLDELLNVVFKRMVAPEDVAAVFIEPIQGEGGYVPAPAGYLQQLREITRRYGIQLVVDEVQSGVGRTGKMFAYEWAGIEPDMVCVAKGIASGLPLGLMIYRSESTDWEHGAHASTFGGNPVACQAALKTLDLIQGGLMENAQVVGEYLLSRLRDLQERYDIIGDVRGRGLMVGAEIVAGKGSKEKSPAKRGAVLAACYRRGLIIIGCGENTIRFAPPLVISKEEMSEGLDVFEAALAEVEPTPAHSVSRAVPVAAA
jgi:4-aminobutyrate aminotransferase